MLSAQWQWPDKADRAVWCKWGLWWKSHWQTAQADTMRTARAMRSFGPTGRTLCFLHLDIRCPAYYSVTRNEVGPTKFLNFFGDGCVCAAGGWALCFLDQVHRRRDQNWKLTPRRTGQWNTTQGRYETQLYYFWGAVDKDSASCLGRTIRPSSWWGPWSLSQTEQAFKLSGQVKQPILSKFTFKRWQREFLFIGEQIVCFLICLFYYPNIWHTYDPIYKDFKALNKWNILMKDCN